MTPRPSPSHKLAIFLPPDSKAPKLVWVQHVTTGQYTKPKVERFLGDSPGASKIWHEEQLLIEPHRIERAKKLDYTIAVYIRDNFRSDGSKPTESAKAITDGKMADEWCGPLLFVAFEGKAEPQKMEMTLYDGSTVSMPAGNLFPRARDIGLRDLRVAVDFLLAYPYGSDAGLTLTDAQGRNVLDERNQ